MKLLSGLNHLLTSPLNRPPRPEQTAQPAAATAHGEADLPNMGEIDPFGVATLAVRAESAGLPAPSGQEDKEL